MTTAPSTSCDVYADDVLIDPYPVYATLRELGSVVWMEAHNAFVLTRYEACRAALRNWQVFTSERGVMMNEPVNQMLGGNVMLCRDGVEHGRLRSVVAAPLTQKAIADVRGYLVEEAESVVSRLVAKGTFDAVTELAHHLPVTVVSSLVGIPEDGRERMVAWGKAVFNTVGPMNERCLASFPLVEEMNGFIANRCTRDQIRPDSWADSLWHAVDEGRLEAHDAQPQLNNYLGPALDTTINATATMIEQFATHPDQWTLLRQRPELIANAIEEVLRIDAAIQGFSRSTTVETEVDGVTIPADARVLVLYASANRDERKFADPDRFDIERTNASDHLSLGHGAHSCAGGHLARWEMRALLEALLPKVERFDIIDTARVLNNVTRGLTTCTVRVKPT